MVLILIEEIPSKSSQNIIQRSMLYMKQSHDIIHEAKSQANRRTLRLIKPRLYYINCLWWFVLLSSFFITILFVIKEKMKMLRKIIAGNIYQLLVCRLQVDRPDVPHSFLPNKWENCNCLSNCIIMRDTSNKCQNRRYTTDKYLLS